MQFSGPPLIAVATGIVGSAWASGAIVSFSVAAPAAKAVPQTTAKVWSELYARGSSIMPKVASVVALSYAYAAYDVSARGGRWAGFAAAAAAVLSIVPFTLTCMSNTNAALHKAAADAPDGPAAAAVPDLIDTWSLMNLARGLFPLVGTVLGLSTFLANA
ncbi:hypothetical protein HRG_010994 [Hirsutella rhossiliensis]|uniref:DUF1772-domain-containing protein n=1 Tax=Hirsutella rhossiliensis TaxID=111463 RepID=A0A9P8SCT3_9HYPO|nr:uncharacterized protein HRG_10994 [Hirsutella rhossiliensis]KAH0957901.1 hypothetical protein HRG_10994 [Hirsutella rhossiliensis]